MAEAEPLPTGQRRPTADDMAEFMAKVAEGGQQGSLRAVCKAMGLHAPSTHTFIHADDGLKAQYEAAKEQRADCLQEDALAVAKAAALGMTVDNKKVDAAGARVLLEAIKWAAGRMAPKTAPVQRLDITSRTRNMTDDEIAAEIAAIENGERAEA